MSITMLQAFAWLNNFFNQGKEKKLNSPTHTLLGMSQLSVVPEQSPSSVHSENIKKSLKVKSKTTLELRCN